MGIDYAEASVMWKQYSSTEGDYPDLDRFNRVTSSRWTKDLATDVDFFDIDITYDRNSNITLIEDNVHTGFDVDYTIDDLNRLTDAQEGTWSGGSISSETRQQIWTLDQPGNWDLMRLDLNGDDDYIDTDELDDDRQHNTANENTDRDLDTDGDGQYDNVLHNLVYDAVGNLTDDKSDYQYVYDAFGRLTQIKSQIIGNPLVAEYEYNGLNQRTGIHFDVDGDGTVENTSDDPRYWLAYDEGWRLLALFVDTDSAPTEEWVPHQAGLSGFGGSSYIDDVILRDRDTDANGSFDERIYYGQNWRHDVVAIVTDTGKMLEWIHYLAYGGMMAQPAGDNDFDFDFDSVDDAALVTPYNVVKDTDLDGDIDSADSTHANGITGGYQTLGFGVISSTGVENRKGYAGYELDHSNAIMYHVRHRVLNNKLGRWTRRDYGIVQGTYNAYVWYSGLAERLNANDVIRAGDDTLEVRCRFLAWPLVTHCFIKCCRPDGTCTYYSLTKDTVDGRAKCVPDYLPDTDDDNSFRAKVKKGAGLCDCAEAAFNANPCDWDYSPFNCNSNWYAGSIWECCTGSRGIAPWGAQFWYDHDCCRCNGGEGDRNNVGFTCPKGNGFPGEDNNYVCPPCRPKR